MEFRPFRVEGDKLHVEGLSKPIDIVSDEEAEKVDFVLCAPASQPAVFPDDVIARCGLCGTPIRHRPHVPKKPMKVCIGCALQATAARPN